MLFSSYSLLPEGAHSCIPSFVLTFLLKQGPLAFWKGAGPSVMKLAPQSVISLVILDNITYFMTGKQAM
jgi:hypothetical protein